MTVPDHSDELARDRRRVLWTWLGGGTVLVLLLWVAVLVEIRREGQTWQQSAEQSVVQFAEAEARNLQAVLDDLRQISSLLAAAREAGADRAVLQRQMRSVSAQRPIFPFYANADGDVISSRTDGVLGMDVSSDPLFVGARSDGAGEPKIYRAAGLGDLRGQTVLRLVRRVERDGRQFDGVVVVSVPESFFRSILKAKSAVAGESLTVWSQDGSPMLNLRGAPSVMPASLLARLDSAGSAGMFRETLADGKQEYVVAWRRIAGLPLLLTASVPSASLMSPAEQIRASHLWTGTTSTLLVFLASLLGARWQLRREERRREREAVSSTFRIAVDGAREAFYMVRPVPVPNSRDVVFRVEDCNEFASRLSGLPGRDIIGRRFVEVFPGFDAAALKDLLLAALREGFRELELAGGSERPGSPASLSFSAVRSAGGIAVSVRDVSAQKETERQLRSMALTDALTLLPNRHWLKQNLGATIDAARAASQKLALLFIDLDDFKKINDSLGHAAGDEFLIAVANALRQSLRSRDTVIRLGGDEFTVLAGGLAGRDDVAAIAGQIVECISRVDCEAVRRGFKARASVGAALFPDDADNDNALMQSADIAMYAAKADGKGRFRMYSTELATQVQSRLALEQGLRQALAGGELQLYYQPRTNARNGSLLSMEALLRWVQPDGSLIEPSRFIPIAEQSDLIVEIGKWVAAEACRQMAAWRDAGLGLVPLSINVSARQLRTEEFRHELSRHLAVHGIPPSVLALELTESAMVGDDAAVRRELHEIRQMGMELHIDDFGTGYSSLSQLQNLDIDAIKIDRSFVAAIGARDQGRALCEAMVQMGRTLGFRVVAEGVETLVQLRELQAMRCDEIQGHYVSAAVPAAAVPGLLARRSFFDPMFPVVQRLAARSSPGPA